MNNRILILVAILFSAFLGLSILQSSGVHGPARYRNADTVFNGFPVSKTAIASHFEKGFTTPIAIRLAEADAGRGPATAARCRTCHSFEQDGGHRIGPVLWNVVGRDIAAGEGYRYSGAFKDIEGNWTAEALDEFLLRPRIWAPGTKMGFAGLGDEAERADLIAWMYQQADAPLALPEPSADDLAAFEAHKGQGAHAD